MLAVRWPVDPRLERLAELPHSGASSRPADGRFIVLHSSSGQILSKVPARELGTVDRHSLVKITFPGPDVSVADVRQISAGLLLRSIRVIVYRAVAVVLLIHDLVSDIHNQFRPGAVRQVDWL